MKDYFKKEINIGDEVIFISPGYRAFIKAIIIGFTPQKVRLKYRHKGTNSKVEILQDPFQLVKIGNIDCDCKKTIEEATS